MGLGLTGGAAATHALQGLHAAGAAKESKELGQWCEKRRSAVLERGSSRSAVSVCLARRPSCFVCRRRWVGTELWGTQRYSSATDICPCTDKMEKAKQAAAEAKAKVEAAVKKPPREWETGICGCFEDCGGCKPVHSTLLGRYAARGSLAIWPTNRAPLSQAVWGCGAHVWCLIN